MLEVSWRVLTGSRNVVGLRALIVGLTSSNNGPIRVRLERFFELYCEFYALSASRCEYWVQNLD